MGCNRNTIINNHDASLLHTKYNFDKNNQSFIGKE